MNKPKRFSTVIFIILMVIGMSLVVMNARSEKRDNKATLRILMTNRADQMQNSIMQSLQQVYSLQALVIGADGKPDDLNKIGSVLTHKVATRNIILAPGGVVSSVYPLQDNKDVMGLNMYNTDDENGLAALRAKETGEMVVSGPYRLEKGGLAISGLMSVKIPDEKGVKQDWGLVSVTIDFPGAMQSKNGSDTLKDLGYNYCVYKYNEKELKYEEVLTESFNKQATSESIDFSIQNMRFRLKAYPKNGWYDLGTLFLYTLVSVVLSALLTLGIGYFVCRSKSLRDKATKDALTGIYNRDSGSAQIEKMLHRDGFKKGVFILLDVDHFKSVNDTLGHQVGDRVLLETAEYLSTFCRKDDLVCRLGGDEFVMFLPCENPDSFIDDKLERLRVGFERNVVLQRKAVHISSSLGVAIAPEDGTNFLELYKNADKALYESKKNGRNCYTKYSELENK